MPATRNLATLHPATVANAEDLAREGRRARRKKPQRGPRAVREECAYSIPAEVLAEAKRLAGGDCSRLVLLPEGAVVVANRADRKHVFR